MSYPHDCYPCPPPPLRLTPPFPAFVRTKVRRRVMRDLGPHSVPIGYWDLVSPLRCRCPLTANLLLLSLPACRHLTLTHAYYEYCWRT